MSNCFVSKLNQSCLASAGTTCRSVCTVKVILSENTTQL